MSPLGMYCGVLPNVLLRIIFRSIGEYSPGNVFKLCHLVCFEKHFAKTLSYENI